MPLNLSIAAYAISYTKPLSALYYTVVVVYGSYTRVLIKKGMGNGEMRNGE